MSGLRTNYRAILASGAALVMAATLAGCRPGHGDPEPGLAGDRVRDLDIEFFEARVARDPEGALDRARLGGLYLQRSRETGSFDDLVRAEAIARQSFGLRTRKNGVALHVLASSLLGQHRYQEALAEATVLTADDPGNLSYRALRGEIEMEMGRYAAAESTFAALGGWRRNLTVAPRLARWEEIHGNVNGARVLIDQARADALTQVNMPKEQKAWFHLRVGDLAFRYGRAKDAERAWRAGLELAPTDHRLLSALARLALSRHQWRRAAEYGETAIAQSLDPATLGLLADAYEGMGDRARADEYFRTMELVALSQPGAYHRAWSLFLLDHDREVARVLENVQAEMVERSDIYGYDLLAWAYHKNGRSCEARDAMARALVLGTREPAILAHADAIGTEPCRNS